MWRSALCCSFQLKWAVPDETGGEVITQYELLVTPQPLGWEGPAADEQVGASSWGLLAAVGHTALWLHPAIDACVH